MHELTGVVVGKGPGRDHPAHHWGGQGAGQEPNQTQQTFSSSRGRHLRRPVHVGHLQDLAPNIKIISCSFISITYMQTYFD